MRPALVPTLAAAADPLLPPPPSQRRLRFGVSLYKTGSTWTVDLSKLLHKTSRFYGPQVSTLPAGIQPFVEAYEQSLVWEPFVGDNPYLFPLASSHQYGQSSSGWTQLVKSVFERYAGVAVPPKQACRSPPRMRALEQRLES